MKFKLMVSDQNHERLKAQLIAHGFEIDEVADFVITERDKVVDHLIGKRDGELHRIPLDGISCIESFGHDVIARTATGDFKINERLRHLELILDPDGFMRISNSVIVSVKAIAKIRPTMSSKFILTLNDGHLVDVTRTYYHSFREILGI